MIIIVLILSLLVGLIIGIFVAKFQIISFKQYHSYWEPIYNTRRKYFDIYLKFALKHRQKHESIENIALEAANMRYHRDCINHPIMKEMNDTIARDLYVTSLKDKYIFEMRAAGIE